MHRRRCQRRTHPPLVLRSAEGPVARRCPVFRAAYPATFLCLARRFSKLFSCDCIRHCPAVSSSGRVSSVSAAARGVSRDSGRNGDSVSIRCRGRQTLLLSAMDGYCGPAGPIPEMRRKPVCGLAIVYQLVDSTAVYRLKQFRRAERTKPPPASTFYRRRRRSSSTTGNSPPFSPVADQGLQRPMSILNALPDSGIPDQQHQPAGSDDLRVVQKPLGKSNCSSSG